MRPGGTSKARCPLDRVSVERECMRLDLFPHPLRERDGGVEHGARQEEHKLLSAIAAGAVDLAHLAAEDARELLQDGVAGLMAILIIHTLEAVQIAHHARERLVQPTRVLEHLVQPLLEMPSIVEPSEGIRL